MVFVFINAGGSAKDFDNYFSMKRKIDELRQTLAKTPSDQVATRKTISKQIVDLAEKMRKMDERVYSEIQRKQSANKGKENDRPFDPVRKKQSQKNSPACASFTVRSSHFA